jgi:hypothetical protein
MLSVDSHVSTASTLARVYQDVSKDPSKQFFSEIGRGQCGKVFAQKGVTKAFKFPLNQGLKDQLFNDWLMHRCIEVAFAGAPPEFSQAICIPRLDSWIGPDESDNFWEQFGDVFEGMRPNYCLCSERILPLPEPLREAIIHSFAPSKIDAKALLMKESNKDCLIRVYLGRRIGENTRIGKEFKLRNFELHINEMEILGLPIDKYATIMADTLAIMNWKALVNADDVEFVFGTTPLLKKAPSLPATLSPEVSMRTGSDLNFHRRSVGLWLLDFNSCQKITLDDQGVKLLVRGFWDNDPYYPRPSSGNATDIELWKHFRARYLSTSSRALTDKTKHLAGQFIKQVEAEGDFWKARAAQSGEGSLFAVLAK